jgi:AcrR family transcriptional regulator
MTTVSPRTGGRGARDRILAAASELFRSHGINATGVEQLAESAHVSKRTLYQHFASKDQLVAAYLAQIELDDLGPAMRALARSDAPARERLLGIFEPDADLRGCPFLNTSAELCDPQHPARLVALERKRAFIDRLVEVAAEAGVADPDQVGHALAVLSDGVRAQSATLNSVEPFRYARALAEQLVR